MTVTSEIIQAALDNDKYYYIPKGTHIITSTIKLDGNGQQHIDSHPMGILIWSGAATGSMFEWELDRDASSYSAAQVHLENITAISTQNGSSIIRARREQPHSMYLENCDFTATGAYCIDFDDCEYTVTPYFLNMRTNGGGAMRFRSRLGGSEGYWFTSLMTIEGWVHSGSHRVGPAFDFLGVRGLLMRGIIDKGSTDLMPALRGYYAGPISMRNNCIGFFSQITSYRCEYDDNFENASGCFLHEFRDDNSYAVGKHGNINLVGMTMHHTGIADGVHHVRFMGGHTAKHVLVADLYNCESVDASKFLIGGRCWVTATRSWYNPGEEDKFALTQSILQAQSPNSFNDPIMTYTGGFPASTTGLDFTYNSGDSRYQNWAPTGLDYEDILGI